MAAGPLGLSLGAAALLLAIPLAEQRRPCCARLPSPRPIASLAAFTAGTIGIADEMSSCALIAFTFWAIVIAPAGAAAERRRRRGQRRRRRLSLVLVESRLVLLGGGGGGGGLARCPVASVSGAPLASRLVLLGARAAASGGSFEALLKRSPRIAAAACAARRADGLGQAAAPGRGASW